MSVLYFTGGELFRMPAGEVLEISLDVAHLTVNVSVGDNHLRAPYLFGRIVCAEQQDRDSGFQRDVVKSFFPFFRS